MRMNTYTKTYLWRRIQDLGPRRLAVLSMLFVLYSLSLFFWLIVPGLYRSPAEWAPFHTVTTDRDPAEAQQLLEQAGVIAAIDDLITERTAEVLITRFNRVESVPLSDALSQLDPLDPRRDPFIEELSAYFKTETEGRWLIYLRVDGSRRHAARVVRRVLGRGSSVVEWNPARIAAGLAMFIAASAFALISSDRLRLIVLSGLIPWIPGIIGSGPAVAVASALILLVWSRALVNLSLLLERNDRRHGPIRKVLRAGVWPGLIIIVSFAVVWSMAGVRAATTILPGVVGISAATAVAFLFRLGGSIRRDHDLFAPVSILSHRLGGLTGYQVFRGRPVVLWIVIGVFVVLPPVADQLVAARSSSVPRQVAVAGADDLSYESIGVLWSSNLPDSIVDLSDYLAHRAYQQSLAFGREYGLPLEGEAVTLSRFKENDEGAYNRFSEDVLVFDDAWLEDAISSAPAGIASLLASRGGTPGVVLTPQRSLYSGYSQLLKHTAYVLLALLPAALSGRRVLQIGRGRSKVVQIARRRRQVA